MRPVELATARHRVGCIVSGVALYDAPPAFVARTDRSPSSPLFGEAVSNSMASLREPRVQTGKRTMFYMGTSLSFVAAGLLLVYLLYHVTPVDGKTLNAVLVEKMTATWPHWQPGPCSIVLLNKVIVFSRTSILVW